MPDMICITCPTGCELDVEVCGDKIKVSGNRCPRGITYAENELKDPRRVVTAVVHVEGGRLQPVRTDQPLPRRCITPLLNRILKEVFAPALPGEIMTADIDGTGVNLIASGPVR